MAKITNLKAIEVLDSRGNPTIEVMMELEKIYKGSVIVPSGASKGSHEAIELKDEDLSRFNGKGVLKAVNNVNEIIYKEIVDKDFLNQKEVDEFLIRLDGEENKKNLGANAILGVSLAYAKAMANLLNITLEEYLGGGVTLPTPLINVINGGAHADSSIDIQEYFIIPCGFDSFKEAMRAGVEIFHIIKKKLKEKEYSTSVGDEGGFAPCFKEGNEEPLILLMECIKESGYKAGEEIYLGIDCASSEFYDSKENVYRLVKSKEGNKTTQEMIKWYQYLVNKYPLIILEDPLSEDDWDGWKCLTSLLGNKINIVGDDLFVTNKKFLQKGIKLQAANSILIKLNQIGTLQETLDTIYLAKQNSYSYIISHRSGDSEDPFIASLAVGTSSLLIKTGSCCRSERIAKYNELLRIEDKLGDKAKFAGKKAFKTLNN